MGKKTAKLADKRSHDDRPRPADKECVSAMLDATEGEDSTSARTERTEKDHRPSLLNFPGRALCSGVLHRPGEVHDG